MFLILQPRSTNTANSTNSTNTANTANSGDLSQPNGGASIASIGSSQPSIFSPGVKALMQAR